MPLVPPVLQTQILLALQKAATAPDMQAAQMQLAMDLATAIDAYIRTATIIIPPGQLVAVVPPAGAPPPAGAGTTVAPSPPALIA